MFYSFVSYVGGTTVLPALRSFCIYCAVGILVVYILQVGVLIYIISITNINLVVIVGKRCF